MLQSKRCFAIWLEVTRPVEIVLAMRPVDDAKQALPVAPVLDPDLLLYAVPKLVTAGRAPQRVHHPHILLWNEFHLHAQPSMTLMHNAGEKRYPWQCLRMFGRKTW